MSFSTDIAKLIADQLSRFVTLNRHQLAGHVANLDFWLGEVRHGLEVIDGYGKRFHQLKTAQAKHVAEHHTTEFDLDDPYCAERTQQMPTPPRKVSESEMRDVRKTLSDTARRFLLRCFHARLIEESRLQQACSDLGIGLDTTDLRTRTG